MILLKNLFFMEFNQSITLIQIIYKIQVILVIHSIEKQITFIIEALEKIKFYKGISLECSKENIVVCDKLFIDNLSAIFNFCG